MIYTSYSLAEKNGAEPESPWFQALRDAMGGEFTEGIPLLDVMDHVGFQDALWCLRAVHPEQESIARKLSSILAVMACQMAFNSLGINDTFLRESLAVASDRIHRMVTYSKVATYRKEVWTHIEFLDLPYRWAGWLVWLALGKNIQATCHEVPECLDLALCDSTKQQQMKAMTRLKDTFRDQVVGNRLKCAGPGIYDPAMKAPTSTKYKMGSVEPRRKYTKKDRHTGIPITGKNHGQ